VGGAIIQKSSGPQLEKKRHLEGIAKGWRGQSKEGQRTIRGKKKKETMSALGFNGKARGEKSKKRVPLRGREGDLMGDRPRKGTKHGHTCQGGERGRRVCEKGQTREGDDVRVVSLGGG